MAEMSNISLLPTMVPAPAVVVLPVAEMSWPLSMLRAVMTPSKGAVTFSKDCSCRRRSTLAWAELTWLVVDLSCESALSVSCWVTRWPR